VLTSKPLIRSWHRHPRLSIFRYPSYLTRLDAFHDIRPDYRRHFLAWEALRCLPRHAPVFSSRLATLWFRRAALLLLKFTIAGDGTDLFETSHALPHLPSGSTATLASLATSRYRDVGHMLAWSEFVDGSGAAPQLTLSAQRFYHADYSLHLPFVQKYDNSAIIS